MNISYRLDGHLFEWDDRKALENFDKHGVTFEEAAEVFFDLFVCEAEDASVGDEDRNGLIGYTRRGRILVVVHVDRRMATRIISARPATRAEKKYYEQHR
ncbi:MAG TPA: BrnT family toxin [Longimicrobium sp.]|nr:BrnT family toxin [Longimicrobium sp.]